MASLRPVISAPAPRMRAVPRFADRRRKSATWPCPHPSTFSILVVFELHDIVLQLSGELDIASTVHLDKCVQVALDEHPRRLIVDASGLEFADVVGLGCLLRTCRKAERVNAEVVLASPNALLRRLIDAAGVANRFRIR